MANNIVFEPGYKLAVVCSDPTTPASGGPVRYGVMTGIALTNEGAGGNIATETTVYFGPGVFDLSVKGVDGSGDSAVAVGDTLYYTDADDPKINKKATGYFYGFAMEAVGSGATGTIRVLHPASPGGGTLAAGGVGTTQLADAGVTAAKLSTNLAIGFIPLPLTSFRLIASNDIPASGTADGGVISQDTAPKLERVNDATDKQLRIAWAATGVVEITTQFCYPPDLDDASAVDVKILAAMNGANDTPVIGINYWEGVGDSNAGGNTAAVTGTTVAEYTIAVAAGNVGAHPKAATIGLIPAAHGTDALYLYGAWIEYARKS